MFLERSLQQLCVWQIQVLTCAFVYSFVIIMLENEYVSLYIDEIGEEIVIEVSFVVTWCILTN